MDGETREIDEGGRDRGRTESAGCTLAKLNERQWGFEDDI